MDWLKALGGGLGSGSSMMDSFLNPGKGYEKAQDQLDKYYRESQGYYGQGQNYLDPFRTRGEGAYGQMSGAMNALLDPAKLQGEWIKSYAESPAAKNAEAMAQQHGLDAASSMGLMGSSPALSAIQAGTSQIGMEDRQNYLNDLMQKYLAGAGMAQNLYGTGLQAGGWQSQNAMNMMKNAMDMGQSSAGMAYGKQNAPGDLFGKLIGTAASFMSGGMGGGGMGAGGGGGGWSFAGA